jgi:hypothetical protein
LEFVEVEDVGVGFVGLHLVCLVIYHIRSLVNTLKA